MSTRLDEAGARVRIESGVARLALDDGREVNILASSRLVALSELVEALDRNPQVGAIILEGNGRGSFAAGANLREIAALDGLAAEALSRRGARLMAAIERFGGPSGALVDGHALGGGCDLAAAADVLVATPRSEFGHPGITRGFFTGWGGTMRLPRRVRARRGAQLLTSGEKASAAQLEEAGLLLACAPEARARALLADALDALRGWPRARLDAWRAARRDAPARLQGALFAFR